MQPAPVPAATSQPSSCLGTYVVLAGSYGGSGGAYRLTLTQEAAAR